jgi:hypothetical protein
LIVKSPHYGNARDAGTLAGQNGCQLRRNESHATKDANQAKTNATIKHLRASQEHLNEEMLSKMEVRKDANQEKMDAWIAEMGPW